MDHRTEILNLLYLYQERIDQGDVEGIGEIFSQAVLRGEDGVNSWKGAEEAAALFRGLLQLYDGSPRTTHYKATSAATKPRMPPVDLTQARRLAVV